MVAACHPTSIVCGVENSGQCRPALHLAARLATRLGARLIVVHVRATPDVPSGLAREAYLARRRAVEHGRSVLAALASLVDDQRLEPGLRESIERAEGRVEFGDPVPCLSRVADELAPAIVVVGTRGLGPARTALLGSGAQALAASPSQPVLIVPPEAEVGLGPPEPSDPRTPSIVCGVDGSEPARNAARVAGRLASALGVRLLLVHAADAEGTGTVSEGHEALLEPGSRGRLRLLHGVLDEVGDAEVEVRLVDGKPAAALDALAAREAAELIAVGTRGHGKLKALALGSVSRTLTASAGRPVLVVNESTGEPAHSGIAS